MPSQVFHLAQANIARMRAPLHDPSMSGFVARLGELNALADNSPGFVWRLQTEAGDATYLRPYADDRIIINLSVWESIEQLQAYVYRSVHSQVMRQRREWFEKFEGIYMALWWVEVGHIPTVAEAKQRLEYLQEHGATPQAFTFRQVFPPAVLDDTSFSAFIVAPCPTV